MSRIRILCMISCLLLSIFLLGADQPVRAEPASPAALDPVVYLPLVLKPDICNPNPQEQQIANLMINHPDQGRPSMTCNRILEQVAGERAQDMADRHYFSHVNPDGFGPNYLVRLAGYVLPEWWGYEPDLNYIESIAGGYPTVAAAWAGWMASPGHKTHLLAEDPFYAEQTQYGIGYVYSSTSDYGHYYVVITAPPEP